MNQSLFYFLNSFAGKSACFDGLVVFFAHYFPYLLVGVFLLILIWEKDRDKKIKAIFLAAASIVLSRLVITEIIRYFYFVSRPFVIDPTVHQLIFHEANGSFPSGHAAFFFALAMVIFFFYKKWGIVFFVSAILIGLARIIAGVHWPIDVLGGAIIGILSSFFIYKIFLTKTRAGANFREET